MIDNTKEYILCAALLRKEPRNTNSYYNNDLDKIEIGYRHHDIRNRFLGEVLTSPSAQGFYTSKGRFVSRKEAKEIAYKAGQLTPDVYVGNIDENTGELVFTDLFSEDLY